MNNGAIVDLVHSLGCIELYLLCSSRDGMAQADWISGTLRGGGEMQGTTLVTEVHKKVTHPRHRMREGSACVYGDGKILHISNGGVEEIALRCPFSLLSLCVAY